MILIPLISVYDPRILLGYKIRNVPMSGHDLTDQLNVHVGPAVHKHCDFRLHKRAEMTILEQRIMF